MRSDLTDITVVMDRSGSMETCQKEAEGGLNSFINEQKQQLGSAVFSLVQFDTDYEFVHRGVRIQDVPRCRLVPRGNTALFDAVGRAIIETGERLSAIPEDQRPGLVVFVILTDGEENSSKEFTKDRIKAMIETQQTTYSWQFTFLAANIDAFAAGHSMGVNTSAIASYAPTSPDRAYKAASSNVTRMRSASLNLAPVVNAYSDDEKKAMAK